MTKSRLQYEFKFDRFGHSAVDKYGVHGIAYAYDEHGRKVEETNLSADGHSIESSSGWARNQRVYDRIGAVVEIRNYGIDGALSRGLQAAVTKYKTDSSGHELERSFFNAQGQPVVHGVSGRARVVSHRDTFGRLTEETSYDVAGHPVNRLDVKWFRRTQQYQSGVLSEVKCFDTGGKPVSPCTENQ